MNDLVKGHVDRVLASSFDHPEFPMRDIFEIIRSRHSSRVPFDPRRRIQDLDLRLILEAARWAPTAHNMQNFEVFVIDDEAILAAIAAFRVPPSEIFLRENYDQLSFSEEELRRRKTGLLATLFPAAWRTPHPKRGDALAVQHSLGGTVQPCPMLLEKVCAASWTFPPT